LAGGREKREQVSSGRLREGRGLPWAATLCFFNATLKAMGLGFCGCSNFFVLKLLPCEFSSPPPQILWLEV